MSKIISLIQENVMSRLRVFVTKNLIGEIPPDIAPCEYCGRKVKKPEGCELIGTEKAQLCPFAFNGNPHNKQ